MYNNNNYAESFVPYTVQVYASTAAGRGRAVSTVMFTGHGGRMSNQILCATLITTALVINFFFFIIINDFIYT